jgi:hypothetical protein
LGQYTPGFGDGQAGMSDKTGGHFTGSAAGRAVAAFPEFEISSRESETGDRSVIGIRGEDVYQNVGRGRLLASS